MRHVRSFVAASAVAIVAASTLPSEAYVRPGRTLQVDLMLGGRSPHCTQTNPFTSCNSDWLGASISPDGRYVAFTSDYSGLTAGNPGLQTQIFLRDLKTGRTVLVTRGPGGEPAVGPSTLLPACEGATSPTSDVLSESPHVSAGGRFVAFQSRAVNLVPGDTNPGGFNVYLFDAETGAIRLVSSGRSQLPSSLTATGDGCGSTYPSISADGRYVSFTSDISNLVTPTVTNGHPNVFVRDMRTGKTVLVNVRPDGRPSGGCLITPSAVASVLGYCPDGSAADYPVSSISATGRWVVFDSEASDLIKGGVTNGTWNVYVRDLNTRRTQLVSVAPGGGEATQPLDPLGDMYQGSQISAGNPLTVHADGDWGTGNAISADGRYVVFNSEAPNLVPNDTNGNPVYPGDGLDVFVYDRKTGRTERVDVTSEGEQFGGISSGGYPSISTDGRVTLFFADFAPIVGPTTYDSVTGALDQVGRAANGTPALYALPKGISGDGRYVLFDGCLDGPLYDASSGDPYYACSAANGADYSQHVWVRDRGFSLGVGGLAASGRLSVRGVPTFSLTGLVSVTGTSDDANEVLTAQGAGLYGASLSYRAQDQDLFARIELQGMPSVSATPIVGYPGIVYGLDLTTSGIRYQIRVQRVSGPSYDPAGGASFGLFRQEPDGVWTQVAALRGGYGTTGEEVVFALPLRDIGAQAGTRLSGLRAFTAVGTYLTGATDVLDQVALSR